MSEVHLARRPVFDRDLKVWGYEILSSVPVESMDVAGPKLMESALHAFGLPALLQGRKAILTVGRTMLGEDFAGLLPPEQTVVCLEKGVDADPSVIAGLQGLRKRGYAVSFDVYVPRKGKIADLLPLGDILRLDLRLAGPDERAACVRRYGRPNVRLQAMNLATSAEHREAANMGFSLLSGDFFRAPEVLARRDIPAVRLNYLRILQEANRPTVDFAGLEAIVKQDVALSVKLLRYVNSASIGLRQPVDSIGKAVRMLGLGLLRRWVSLLALASMGEDRPQELVVSVLVRAKFCESIAEAAGFKDPAVDAFLMGLLSMVDVLLGRPMQEIVDDLPLTQAVKDALSGLPTPPGRLLRIADAYEKGDWHKVTAARSGLALEEKRLPQLYKEALAWADQAVRGSV